MRNRMCFACEERPALYFPIHVSCAIAVSKVSNGMARTSFERACHRIGMCEECRACHTLEPVK